MASVHLNSSTLKGFFLRFYGSDPGDTTCWNSTNSFESSYWPWPLKICFLALLKSCTFWVTTFLYVRDDKYIKTITYFYDPRSNHWEHIDFSPVCLLSTIFDLYFWIVRGGGFIFGTHSHLIMPFQITKVNEFVTLTLTLTLSIAVSKFVATGDVVFRKYILVFLFFTFSWNLFDRCSIKTGEAHSFRAPDLALEYLFLPEFATVLVDNPIILCFWTLKLNKGLVLF